ncbi:hypothetical protein E2562_004161 [Oryza meyeriana var. granulata]|uniref:Uncharacterized protein n=1 Tax=Oryza meyeriana var. granulata TaxID=110450 RepID=A0A6G1BSH6_9ORYZ|nr:hypothetical protein E2562_004161 [Oryza meyeriana var. granulata]
MGAGGGLALGGPATLRWVQAAGREEGRPMALLAEQAVGTGSPGGAGRPAAQVEAEQAGGSGPGASPTGWTLGSFYLDRTGSLAWRQVM